MKRVIQVITEAKSIEEAQSCLDQGMRIMLGFMGGRILPPCEKHGDYHVQAFFEDCDPAAPFNGWLPDGMRRVILTTNVARSCGMNIHII